MGRLQFGHDSSPWMTAEPSGSDRWRRWLQFGHDSSPWMTRRRGGAGGGPPVASIRPRLIAVDDGALTNPESEVRLGLQFGHDSSPWMTSVSSQWPHAVQRLQFGHDSSPWMTRVVRLARRVERELQFGHDSSPWMTKSVRTVLLLQGNASIRPRLIAVDDPAWSCTADPRRPSRFNSATTHRRG